MVEDTPTTPGWGKREAWGPPDRPSPSRGTSSKGAQAGGDSAGATHLQLDFLETTKALGE